LEGLRREIRWWASRLGGRRVLDTLYVGGGTPSILPPEILEECFSILDGAFERPDFCEATVEANPGTLTESLLDRLEAHRVNRISLGVQSLDEGELRLLGRIHDGATAWASAEAVRRRGIKLNCDLMFALPSQGLRSWARTLEGVLALEPDHISTYQLTVEPGTEFDRADPELPEGYPFYRYAQWRLRRAGFLQYEIAAFARVGVSDSGGFPRARVCRHNLAYWEGREVLGVGPAAWGFLAGVRYGNRRTLADWAGRLAEGRGPVGGIDRLGDSARAREMAILATRTCFGLRPAVQSRRHGGDGLRRLLSRLGAFPPDWVEFAPGSVRLSPRGMRMANQVWTEMVRSVEEG
jgi:oxygen-independent coproporphyrinogen-3 oxidase